MELLTGFAISILAGILVDELTGWIPKLSGHIARGAAGRLCGEDRERYAEEWTRHLDEIPGRYSRLLHALLLYWAASKLVAQSNDREARLIERWRSRYEEWVHRLDLRTERDLSSLAARMDRLERDLEHDRSRLSKLQNSRDSHENSKDTH